MKLKSGKKIWFISFLFLIIGLMQAVCSHSLIASHPQNFSTATGSEAFDLAYEVGYEWLEGPSVGRNKPNQIAFSFKRKDGSLPVIEHIQFFPFMKVHGHGGSGHPTLIEHGLGKAVFNNFGFTMSGSWELEVRVRLDGQDFALSLPCQIRNR